MTYLMAVLAVFMVACAAKGLMVWGNQSADWVDRKLRERQQWKQYRAMVPKRKPGVVP